MRTIWPPHVTCARLRGARAARRRRAAAAHLQPRPRELPAYLEDHAYLLEAYLTLYEATFDATWFSRAVSLAETILERFHDPSLGGFFSVADDHTGLIARRKDLQDAPIPSGGSAAAFGLLRLARMTGEARYEDAALSLIRQLHELARQHPLSFGHALRAIDFQLAPVREVALAGEDVVRWRRSCEAASGPTPCWPGATVRSRCSKAEFPSTVAPPPTSASTSPASCRYLAPKN